MCDVKKYEKIYEEIEHLQPEDLLVKKYILIAGVNGAGKSTLYQTLQSLQGMPRVNTDEI